MLKGIVTIQKKAIRNIFCKKVNEHTAPLFSLLGELTLVDLFKYNCAVFMYKFNNRLLPTSFENVFTPCNPPNRTNSYKVVKNRISFLNQFPTSFLPKTWNALDRQLKFSSSLSIFKRKLKNSLLEPYDLTQTYLYALSAFLLFTLCIVAEDF